MLSFSCVLLGKLLIFLWYETVLARDVSVHEGINDIVSFAIKRIHCQGNVLASIVRIKNSFFVDISV